MTDENHEGRDPAIGDPGRPVGGDGQPYNEYELRDFREHQSKRWNPAYNGHRWLATLAVRDAEIKGLRSDLIKVLADFPAVEKALAETRAALAFVENLDKQGEPIADIEQLKKRHNYQLLRKLQVMEERDHARNRVAELEAMLLTAVEKLERHDAPRPGDPFPACGQQFPKITDEINALLARGVTRT